MNIPNLITSFRIVFAAIMLFFPGDSEAFFIFYILGGLTDIFDGLIARRLHAESAFGARLDSAADIIFIAAAMFRLLPNYSLKPWLWFWLSVIVLIKLFGYAYSYHHSGSISLPHTVLNKFVGCLLFLFPLAVKLLPFDICAIAVCIFATSAALHELIISFKICKK